MSKTVIALLAILVPAFITVFIAIYKLRSAKKLYLLQVKEKELQVKALEQDLANAQQEKFESIVKYSFFQQLMDLTAMSHLSNSVKEIFRVTKADRFLILVAVNGKTDFKIVSVVYEQYPENQTKFTPIEATKMYKNIGIDEVYKSYLKQSDITEFVELSTDSMENGILKSFYEDENVRHCLIKSITRKPLDDQNDFLVYSSIATHMNRSFTEREKNRIKNHYEAIIIPNVIQVLENPIVN